MSYQRALEESDPARGDRVAADSPEEQAAIERFKDLFANLSPERVREKVRSVYADDVYFNDTLKQVRGIDALEAYLIESAEAAHSVTVRVDDVIRKDGDYYFRWVMDIEFKRFKPGTSVRTIGISHLRFNRQGKVVLHQDYWDSSSGLFEHIPLVGWMIRQIKRRL